MTEKLNLPTEVIDSDWRDDIDYETYGNSKQEREYISLTEVSKESIERIKSRNLKRGQAILSIFSKNSMVA